MRLICRRRLADLVLATQKVAKLLDKAFDDVGRTGMFFEGYGVDHVHSKLSPMHGTGDMTQWRPIESRQTQFFAQYEGYLSSHDHERADDEKAGGAGRQNQRGVAIEFALPFGKRLTRPGIIRPGQRSTTGQCSRINDRRPYRVLRLLRRRPAVRALVHNRRMLGQRRTGMAVLATRFAHFIDRRRRYQAIATAADQVLFTHGFQRLADQRPVGRIRGSAAAALCRRRCLSPFGTTTSSLL